MPSLSEQDIGHVYGICYGTNDSITCITIRRNKDTQSISV